MDLNDRLIQDGAILIYYLFENGYFNKRKVINGDRNRLNVMLNTTFSPLNDSSFFTRFRMNQRNFYCLLDELNRYGFSDLHKNFITISPNVSLLIFLEWVGNDSCQKIQAGIWTISESTVFKCRYRVVDTILNGFYQSMVHFGLDDVIYDISYRHNDYFAPFGNIIGAMDGTHITVQVNDKLQIYRNRHKKLSTNVLLICNFSMLINFAYVGCAGSTHDSGVLQSAEASGFVFPRDKIILADCGYALRLNCILTPYKGTRYHLKEFTAVAPENAKETFNLRHAKLRNCIERCNGVLKRRFKFLRSGQGIELDIQNFNKTIYCCIAIHNFIRLCNLSTKNVSADEDQLFDDDNAIVEEDNEEENIVEEEENNNQNVVVNANNAYQNNARNMWRNGIADALFLHHQHQLQNAQHH